MSVNDDLASIHIIELAVCVHADEIIHPVSGFAINFKVEFGGLLRRFRVGPGNVLGASPRLPTRCRWQIVFASDVLVDFACVLPIFCYFFYSFEITDSVVSHKYIKKVEYDI